MTEAEAEDRQVSASLPPLPLLPLPPGVPSSSLKASPMALLEEAWSRLEQLKHPNRDGLSPEEVPSL